MFEAMLSFAKTTAALLCFTRLAIGVMVLTIPAKITLVFKITFPVFVTSSLLQHRDTRLRSATLVYKLIKDSNVKNSTRAVSLATQVQIFLMQNVTFSLESETFCSLPKLDDLLILPVQN